MKYKSRLTGRNRTMLTAANNSLQRSRSRKRARDATRKVFLLGMLGGVSAGAMMWFSGSPENTPASDPVIAAAGPSLASNVQTVLYQPEQSTPKQTPKSGGEKVRVERPADIPVAKAEKLAEPPVEKKLAEKPVAPKALSDDASGGAVAESDKPTEAVEAAIQPAGERVKQMLKARKTEKPTSYPGVDQILSKI